MMIPITLAGPAEAGIIADLSRRTFEDTFAAFNTPENMEKFLATQFSREKLMAEPGMPGVDFFLAWWEGRAVGYAKTSQGPNPPGLGDMPALELSRIYTLQEALGKGIGKALLARCLTHARNLGKQKLWLGVWENNTRAIRFYEKNGFVTFGTHPFILGDDIQTDWLMAREVNGN